jgi:hypothetical protein
MVETGTFGAVTTEILAEEQLPVFTIESNPRYCGFAWIRLLRRRNVMLRCGDTRDELKKLIEGPLGSKLDCNVFFYLDAHWNEDLPLAQELEIIFSRFCAAVVIVDDFEVPGDPGYGYDNYGPGQALNLDYIGPIMPSTGLQCSIHQHLPLRKPVLVVVASCSAKSKA